jgi:hypothetical protein
MHPNRPVGYDDKDDDADGRRQRRHEQGGWLRRHHFWRWPNTHTVAPEPSRVAGSRMAHGTGETSSVSRPFLLVAITIHPPSFHRLFRPSLMIILVRGLRLVPQPLPLHPLRLRPPTRPHASQRFIAGPQLAVPLIPTLPTCRRCRVLGELLSQIRPSRPCPTRTCSRTSCSHRETDDGGSGSKVIQRHDEGDDDVGETPTAHAPRHLVLLLGGSFRHSVDTAHGR